MCLLQNSMLDLVQQLASKEPYYIRCIKPNEDKSSVKFDEERVEHQVCFSCFIIPFINVIFIDFSEFTKL